MQTHPLKGRRALVCGASRGIGRAVAEELAAQGAELVLLARDQAALDLVAATLANDPHRDHRVLAVDMMDAQSLVTRVATVLEPERPVHILVNNTGGPRPGQIQAADAEAFVPAFMQHVVAAHSLARLLLDGMRVAGYGRIVNIISTSVKQPIPGLGISNTIRGAMANWAKTLAAEVAADGITVNNVLPGATRTERLQELIRSRADREGRATSEVESEMMRAIPARRFAEAEEIAQAAAFLASPAAAYITGVNLPVDGGRTGSL